MNTQTNTALSDAALELITGGCNKRSYDDSDSCSEGSDDYGCESSEGSDYGCEGSEGSDDYSCHKRRFRRGHRRHHNSW